MKKLATTLCIVGTAIALSACETGTTHHSGANFANDRTAGNVGAAPHGQPERVFKAAQTK